MASATSKKNRQGIGLAVFGFGVLCCALRPLRRQNIGKEKKEPEIGACADRSHGDGL
jgi:hypothetical protein